MLSRQSPTLSCLSRLTGTTFFLILALFLGLTPSAFSQSSSSSFAEVVEVRVVNVEVFVTDRSGLPIEGLSQEDFTLTVDGKEMPVSNFYAETLEQARASVEPLRRQTDPTFHTVEEVPQDPTKRAHIVILVDHTRLRHSNRKRTFNAIREAVVKLDPDDLISVVGVEGSLVFYSDFLYDRSAIGKILDQVAEVSGKLDIADAERRLIFGELARGSSGGYLARSSQADADSLNARIRSYAAEEFARSNRSLNQIERVVATLAGVPGRKAILWVGEGIPTRPGEGLYVEWRNRFGSFSEVGIGLRHYDLNTDYTREVGNYDLSQRVEQVALTANRAGVTLYAIDAEGDHGQKLRSSLTEQGATSESVSVVEANYREPLEFTTKATGGRLLRSSGQLVEELGKLTRDFDSFYSLGFIPPDDWDAGTEHTIKVKVRGKKLLVRHRNEVRLPKAGEREASATVAALMYQTVNNPLNIKATPGAKASRDDGNTALEVILEIPVGSLTLVPQGESHAASIAIFVSIKDKDGNPGAVQKIPFHLNIPNDKVDDAKANSAHYPLPVILRPGDRQAAISVKDDIDGTLSTVRLELAEFAPSL